MKLRTYLYVPSAERAAAEALGAKWDRRTRKCYVPEGTDTDPFKAWLPLSDEGDYLRINGPLFVAESKTTCWSCKEQTPVIALAAEILDEGGAPWICPLQELEELPSNLLSFIEPRYPFFSRSFSETGGMAYLMNHCRCGASLEDWDLHNEPEGSFFPISPEAGRTIVLRSIPESGAFLLKAGYAATSADFIGRYAARRPF